MKSVEDKRFRENLNTFYVQYIFPPTNRAVYEIMWENIAKPDRS